MLFHLLMIIDLLILDENGKMFSNFLIFFLKKNYQIVIKSINFFKIGSFGNEREGMGRGGISKGEDSEKTNISSR